METLRKVLTISAIADSIKLQKLLNRGIVFYGCKNGI